MPRRGRAGAFDPIAAALASSWSVPPPRVAPHCTLPSLALRLLTRARQTRSTALSTRRRGGLSRAAVRSALQPASREAPARTHSAAGATEKLRQWRGKRVTRTHHESIAALGRACPALCVAAPLFPLLSSSWIPVSSAAARRPNRPLARQRQTNMTRTHDAASCRRFRTFENLPRCFWAHVARLLLCALLCVQCGFHSRRRHSVRRGTGGQSQSKRQLPCSRVRAPHLSLCAHARVRTPLTLSLSLSHMLSLADPCDDSLLARSHCRQSQGNERRHAQQKSAA